MERLRVSDNKRYLVTQSGQPVVWIADTDWTFPQRMKWDDVEYFLQNRRAQGFTVLQICALDPERDEQMRNPAGEKALIDDDLLQPNEGYFRYLDYILDKAEEYGFYVLLLPVWGQLVVGEDWSGNTYEKTVTEENAYEYGKWIGNRYKDRANILWCLGGDRQPIHKLKDDYRPVWRLMAEGLAKGITGQDLKTDVKDPLWQKLMITYHACNEAETGECSTMSYWTDEEAWISFIMLQSGHGKWVKNFNLVKREYDRENIMPVWDGEPAYEAMPTCWPITDANSFHGTEIIRKRAYWSLLAGAFGYTYGHANIWCSVGQREKNFIATTGWYEGLHSEGSKQIASIHNFILDMKAYDCKPCQEILVEQTAKEGSWNPDIRAAYAKEGEAGLNDHIQAAYADDGNALCVYFPSGGGQTLAVADFAKDAAALYGWWYDTKTGDFCDLDKNVVETALTYAVTDGKVSVQAPEEGLDLDWLLILKKEEGDAPIEKRTFGPALEEAEIKKVFEW